MCRRIRAHEHIHVGGRVGWLVPGLFVMLYYIILYSWRVLLLYIDSGWLLSKFFEVWRFVQAVEHCFTVIWLHCGECWARAGRCVSMAGWMAILTCLHV